MWDAQNATFRHNSFGARKIKGIRYRADSRHLAIRFFDSGRRTDLWNGVAVSNLLHGESISGCPLADSIVRCASNRG
jgi:hypothetical protein